MIINIRGTSGAGKSTLVRKILTLYAVVIPKYHPRSRRPKSLLLSGATNNKALFVLGHCEIPCGGGDTVSNRDEAFAMLREARNAGADILFEGVVHSDEVRRTVELYRDHPGAVVLLDTPIETCIERIKQRRAAAANAKPLREQTTRQRVASIERACERLKQQNITVERLASDSAYLFIRQKLGLGT